MPRGTVNIQQLSVNAGSAYAGTAIDGVNGLIINAGGKTRDLLLRITNSGGTIGTVLINPGSYPPAYRSQLGTVTGTLAATTGEMYIAVESARVVQADGSIYIDFLPTTMAGQVYAYRLPPDV